MKNILCFLFLFVGGAVPSRALEQSAAKHAPLSKTSLDVVDYVVGTDLSQLNPKLVAHFMTLDLDALPQSKREKAKLKKLEIQTALKLRKINSGSKTHYVSAATCQAEHHPASYVPILVSMGYREIEEGDEEYLEKRTKCSEDNLICEFSLNVIVIPQKKGRPKRRFFLHPRDPLNAYIAEYHAGGKPPTNFFGSSFHTCVH